MFWKVRKVDLQNTSFIFFRGSITKKSISLLTDLHCVSEELVTLGHLVILMLQTIFHSISKIQWVQMGFICVH